MPLTEAEANRVTSSPYSTLSLSATLSLHSSILSAVSPSTFARYTLFTNISFPILSTYPNHFIKFLSFLSSTLNSYPHLSLLSYFLTLSTLLMPHCFSNMSSQIPLFFSTPLHLMATFPNHTPQLVLQLFNLFPVLLLWISCSLSTTLTSSPKSFSN